MDKGEMSIKELSKWAALLEVANRIESEADRRKINPKQRWKLYKNSHISKFIKERAPEIEMELTEEERTKTPIEVNPENEFSYSTIVTVKAP